MEKTMNHPEPVTTRHIALANLALSPLNVRKTLTKAGIDEMKASILAHGLMQNLVVTAAVDGAYLVVAGGRRLAALQALRDEGALPEDFAVACQLVTEARAAELSLAENTVRLAMHPADQFEAFAGLIDSGQTATQVAQRFGVEETLVRKRMKLGRAAPELLKAYREEQLTLECLMAFTITDDHARQLKVYAALTGWRKDDPRHIREMLTESMAEADSKLARFVGLDAYEAAGGTLRSDLFSDEVYLENPELLDALAAEKLKLVEKDLQAEGWSWVEVSPEHDWAVVSACHRIHPKPAGAPQELLDAKAAAESELDSLQQAFEETESDDLLDALDATETRLADINEKLEALAVYDPEEKKRAGCYVSIDHDGSLCIEEGLIRREAMTDPSGEETAPDTKAGKPKGMPQALARDLESYRLQAAQAEIARHPAIAFDLLVFHVARYGLAMRPIHDGPDVHFTQHFGTDSVRRAPTAAAAAFDAIKEGLPAEWASLDSEAAQFEAFRLLPAEGKQRLLAYCVACTLQPKLGPSDGAQATAYDIALSLTGANPADYWRPSKENYLRRIPRDPLLDLGRELLGDAWAHSRWKARKADLVEELDRAFADPGKAGRSADQAERLKCWLPQGMAFALACDTVQAESARMAA
jgi:ParB family chromosome partitioning protein